MFFQFFFSYLYVLLEHYLTLFSKYNDNNMKQNRKNVNISFVSMASICEFFHLSGCNQMMRAPLKHMVLFREAFSCLKWPDGETKPAKKTKPSPLRQTGRKCGSSRTKSNVTWRWERRASRRLICTSLFLHGWPPSLASSLFKIHFHVHAWWWGEIMSSHCVIALPAHRCAFKC